MIKDMAKKHRILYHNGIYRDIQSSIEAAIQEAIEDKDKEIEGLRRLSDSQHVHLKIYEEKIDKLQAVSDLYYDLLYCVVRKHPGETRHETAKKYLIDSEKPQNNVPQKSATPEAK